MAMLMDFYVTYEVYDKDDGEYFFCGGQNIAAVDRNDAINQVEEMFGKYGKIVIQDLELISDEVQP